MDRQQASSALFGAAILHAIPGLLFWAVAGLNFTLDDWITILGSGTLVALGIAARWFPLPAAVVALLGYLPFFGLLAFVGMPPIGWILRGTTLALLIIGLVAALSPPPAEEPAAAPIPPESPPM